MLLTCFLNNNAAMHNMGHCLSQKFQGGLVKAGNEYKALRTELDLGGTSNPSGLGIWSVCSGNISDRLVPSRIERLLRSLSRPAADKNGFSNKQDFRLLPVTKFNF